MYISRYNLVSTNRTSPPTLYGKFIPYGKNYWQGLQYENLKNF